MKLQQPLKVKIGHFRDIREVIQTIKWNLTGHEASPHRTAYFRLVWQAVQLFLALMLLFSQNCTRPGKLCGIPAISVFWFASLLIGCGGPRSALDPAGYAANRVADLYWWMVAGAVVIWLFVVGLTVYAIRTCRQDNNERTAKLLIVGGGIILPVVVLTALLVYGMAMLPEFTAPAPAGSLKVSIHGKQWWWRVRYELASGQRVELANEIRLPVNEPVEFRLESFDVNHSFWIPPLGGKLDLIPGRVTRLALKPTRTGVFQGMCAEYCGLSHAWMQFPVVIVEKDEFTRWLADQAQPAVQPAEAQATRGLAMFLSNACNACHAVRGTLSLSAIGPDLTHVGSRLSIAAGTLPNDPNSIKRWISHTKTIKPGTLMPAFSSLPEEDLEALAVYLKGLR